MPAGGQCMLWIARRPAVICLDGCQWLPAGKVLAGARPAAATMLHPQA
jgi:hypothetical protein